jgi:predicted DsbA family dithiol-disulfide isomerase
MAMTTVVNRGAAAGCRSLGRTLATTTVTTTNTSNNGTTKKLVIPVELISDTMWPNGYIGKKHLRRAMDHVLKTTAESNTSTEVVFSVVRVPLLLEPHYPEEEPFVETNRARLETKFGGPGGWYIQKSRHDLKGRGLNAGIPHFNLDRLTYNTLASHRLVQKIGKVYRLGVSETLYDALNVYHFVDGHSLNDHLGLAKLTHQTLTLLLEQEKKDNADKEITIMSEEEIVNFLQSKEGYAEIESAHHALSTQLNIHSIPQFLIEGKTLIDGAVDSSVFIKVFNKIIQRGYVHNNSKPIFADILGLTTEIVQQGSHTHSSLSSDS